MTLNNIQKKEMTFKFKLFASLLIAGIFLFGIKDAIALPDHAEFCPKPNTIISTNISGAATEIAFESAVLNGVVNPSGNPTIYWFDYGQDKDLNANTGFIYAGQGNKNVTVSISIRNLIPNTVYFYKIISSNDFGKTNGEVLTFKTKNI